MVLGECCRGYHDSDAGDGWYGFHSSLSFYKGDYSVYLGLSQDMPFKSKKQRTYLAINKPKLYKKWKAKYGVKIKGRKKRG